MLWVIAFLLGGGGYWESKFMVEMFNYIKQMEVIAIYGSSQGNGQKFPYIQQQPFGISGNNVSEGLAHVYLF